jgi:hypothetical protein
VQKIFKDCIDFYGFTPQPSGQKGGVTGTMNFTIFVALYPQMLNAKIG